MYRKPGAQGPLSGVPSGPYTGGEHSIDPALLAPATRLRIAKALLGRGEPSMIAYESPRALSSWVHAHASWGMVIATAVLATVFAIGFDNPDSSWARPPLFAIGIFGGAGALFAVSLFIVLRRRALLGGSDALRPGKYLFPLDIVDVGVPDRNGYQTLVVRSLGDARDARIESSRSGVSRRTDLLIMLDDSSSVRFPLRGDPEGEVATRRLEHAQRLLEELTYASTLEEAFPNDLFFDMRIDKSWDAVAPSPTSKASASLMAKRPILTTIVLGRAGPFCTAALAVLLGVGSFFARRDLGDQALLTRAWNQNTPDAFDAYLANGGERREEALRLKGILLKRDERAKDDKAREAAAEKASLSLGKTVEETREQCIDSLRKSAIKYPNVPRIIERVIERGFRTIAVDFRRKIQPPANGNGNAPDVPLPNQEDLGNELIERERVTRVTLERIFSEACPARVVEFIPASGGVNGNPVAPVLQITYDLTWQNKIYPPVAGATVSTRGFEIAFDVVLRAPGNNPRIDPRAMDDLYAPTGSIGVPDAGEVLSATFHLTMPTPTEATTKLRSRSIFTLPDPEKATGINRVYSAMTARAFDRLYDELYGLFFTGDPRVPLKSSDVPVP